MWTTQSRKFKRTKMAGLGETTKRHFPLQTIDHVVRLFRSQLENNDDPNLILLSIVVGYIENMLTCNRIVPSPASEMECHLETVFPMVELVAVEALYGKFQSQIKGSVDLSQYKSQSSGRFATRELVKKVSDVVWGSLTRSYYKDRAHLQTLYSYLTGNKLDCFGVAYAVVAACQALGFGDVHLSLSEDHAWVTFGKEGDETAEVTWHGKGNEDKRGQPVTSGCTEKSWLYLNGYPVKCTRHTEVAALVSGINPSINATTDSMELATLQQKLLWVLYDLGHLKNYPMALGNLGDLEEISLTPGRPPPIELFREAILAAQSYYNNQHVYPYTYLGGYLYRNGRYKEALEAWANAADVIRKYNYGREDEEIYKEFLEIANELIPHIIKVVSTGGCEPSGRSTIPLLQDPQCFAYLLRFYDGLCEWEEGSSTPVLHIGWARPLVATISKFPASIRARVDIHISEEEEDKLIDENEKKTEKDDVKNNDEDNVKNKGKQKENKLNEKDGNIAMNGSSEKNSNKSQQKITSKKHIIAESEKSNDKPASGQESEFLRSLVTHIDPNEAPHPNIMALAAACGDNILNPEYLLGSGEPFSSRSSSSSSSSADCRDLLSTQSNGTPFPGLTVDSMLKADSPADLLQGDSGADTNPNHRVDINLTSQKMAGLRELLLAEKLNTSAIQLQLTAQSQVQVVKRGRHSSEFDFVPTGRTTKRSRRE
ncbi:menin [Centruroides vittatus]|uniref:menin n=1 Tax=Centruroides vittatus TaxID=120091 RepID=UPI00350F440D